MKLTDEKVAKALGWKQDAFGSNLKPQFWPWMNPRDTKRHADIVPPFTTSLDMIVDEIEARGIKMQYQSDKSGVLATIDDGKNFYAIKGDKTTYATGPAALCAALLSYLKAKPTGGTK